MHAKIESALHSRFGVFAGPEPEDPVFLGLLGAQSLIEPAKGFFSPPFFPDVHQPNWYPVRELYTLSKREFIQTLGSMNPASFPEVYEIEPQERSRFLEAVSDLQNKFRSSSLRKVVPYARARTHHAPLRNQQLNMIISALHQQACSGGYVFALCEEERGMLGLTPELLFEKKGDQVHTMALAGTRLDEPGAVEKLLSDQKELIEHEWVVHGIRESLQDLGALQFSAIKVRRSGRLLHLETKIILESSSIAFAEVVKRLHPTPALGGYPKSEAIDWLKRYNELSPRSRFGAPFGFKSKNVEVCLVAIRGVEWSTRQDCCQMSAGCGITENSIPDAEWREIENKWRSISLSLGNKEFT